MSVLIIIWKIKIDLKIWPLQNHVNLQGNRIIQIVVHDPVIDRPKRALTSLSSPSSSSISSTSATGQPPSITPLPTTAHVIKGDSTHSFNITCKSIPEDGVNRTVVHVFQEKYVPYDISF